MAKTLTATQGQKFSPQSLYPFEFFDLLGLDTYNPDELADPRRCVYGRNFRLFAPASTTKRMALAKRSGHTFYSVPVGETQDQAITSVTGASAKSVGLITWIAQKLTAGATGVLTRVDINVENIASATGPLVVAFYSDNSGTPGTLLATSSISNSSITGSLGYLSARYIEAPTVTSGTVYWIVVYIQANGSNTYAWSSTTSATTAKVSTDNGSTWSTTSFAMNFKTFVSTSGSVRGLVRYYSSIASPVQIFAFGTNVYKVNDNTGAVTSIKSGLSASATIYDWAIVNDKLYFVNGFDAPQVYNGTTVAAVGGSPPTADNVEIHSNSLFLLQPGTNLCVFSDPGSYETFGPTAFIYFPSPKTADPVIRIMSVEGVLFAFTRNTKYLLYGTTNVTGSTTGSTGNLIVKESPATRGIVSPTAVCKDQGTVYFMSGDYHIYMSNGAKDTKLSSERVSAYLRNMANLSGVRLFVQDKKLFVSYTPTGQTSNQNRLVYDLVFNEWLSDEEVYTNYGIGWNSQSDIGQFVLGSSRCGALYTGDSGNSDLGKPIKFDWWSKYMSFGAPAAKHRVKRYYVFLQGEDGSYSVDCQVDQDNLGAPTSNMINVDVTAHKYGDSGLLYGTVASGGSGLTYGNSVLQPKRISISGAYHKTQFRFVQAGIDEPLGILGFSTYILPKKPK